MTQKTCSIINLFKPSIQEALKTLCRQRLIILHFMLLTTFGSYISSIQSPPTKPFHSELALAMLDTQPKNNAYFNEQAKKADDYYDRNVLHKIYQPQVKVYHWTLIPILALFGLVLLVFIKAIWTLKQKKASL